MCVNVRVFKKNSIIAIDFNKKMKIYIIDY